LPGTASARPTARAIRTGGRVAERAAIDDQGLGWKSKHRTGFGADTITSGPEVTQTPTKWSNLFFKNCDMGEIAHGLSLQNTEVAGKRIEFRTDVKFVAQKQFREDWMAMVTAAIKLPEVRRPRPATRYEPPAPDGPSP
jgi:catalase (peroxidase I)